jgi:hypothetical protein
MIVQVGSVRWLYRIDTLVNLLTENRDLLKEIRDLLARDSKKT